MGSGCVVARFGAPARAVWDCVSWRGVAALQDGPFARIDFLDDMPGVGSTKVVRLQDGAPIVERLEAVDEADFTYRYRIVDMGPLPVTDFTGYVRVTPAGPDACFLKIACEFTPVLVGEAEWLATWRGIEEALIARIRERVETPAAAGQAGQ